MSEQTPTITIKQLYFSYKDKEIFHNFQISFPAKKCSAIMAPSGRGKTTLLYLIAGLLPISKGYIYYPIQKPSFSFVFQENRLIKQISIANNLRLVNPKLNNLTINEYLSQIGLTSNYINKTPNQLSGGEQRKIAILRALLADYDILLLDEPFTGLDYNSKKIMMEYIHKNTLNKTVILVTHQQEEAIFLCEKNIFKL